MAALPFLLFLLWRFSSRPNATSAYVAERTTITACPWKTYFAPEPKHAIFLAAEGHSWLTCILLEAAAARSRTHGQPLIISFGSARFDAASN